jgi:hypothetical protein
MTPMAFGCLFDLLRLVLGALTLLCVALVVAGLWLGPDHVAVLTATISPTTELKIHVFGPSPDLRIVLLQQDLARGMLVRISTMTLRAWPVGVSTIGLCLLVMVLERRGEV